MYSKPKTRKRLMVQKLTTNFREAVVVETVDICSPPKNEICIKNKYVGVDASDINTSKGRYFITGRVPFGVGCEGVGEVIAVGEGVSNLRIGQSVAYMNSHLNSYAEYVCVPSNEVIPIPEIIPEYMVALVSGFTATLSLDKAAHIKSGETVLITAAAGGAGHMAVQWAKLADCHVIGTCSTEEKKAVLKELGCDRVINYKEEDIDDVLSKEYKNGVNVIWETIGGEVFETCLKHLSRKGRLIVVGGISGYKSEGEETIPKVDLSLLPGQLLMKSAAVQGFLLTDYTDFYGSYFKRMMEKLQNGQLRPIIDNGERTTGREFFGVEGIIKGVEHLHSGKNIGKVVVRIY